VRENTSTKGEKKMTEYRYRTTEELIKLYAEEQSRISDSDRQLTQSLIKKELKRRFNAVIKLLDDDQTANNPTGTYNYLLGK
jgi:hypothetical protein